MADKLENIQLSSADSTVTNTTTLPDNLQSTNTNTADSSPDNHQTIPDNPVQNCAVVADSSPDSKQTTPDSSPDNKQIKPDCTVDSEQTTPDSSPDNKQTTPDSTTDSKQPTPDSTVADSQNVDIFSKISILEFLKKYEIGRDSLYGRMRYLQITTYKIKNKAYLDGVQAGYMDGLHEHIKATGRMEGYPIPEPSGPVGEETSPTVVDAKCDSMDTDSGHFHDDIENNQPTSAIALTTPDRSMADGSTEESGMAVSQSQTLSAAENEQAETVRQHEVSQMNALGEQVMKNAQNKAAGVLIAENMLAQQFIENPEMLPEELKAKIQESAQIPEVDPFAYANALIDFAKGAVAA
ncbi:hypothetical protein [Brunnivagina elsteri]|uniref:Uncharacterized protein n=1 Tax=Brunnivagina elsteri CCALA 953 TaxID=987040 RepID=A0A2A2TDF6_9CYAN|nr:hypothetical protein [Calothrix elsteri]PAX51449.1 hypothetical protein CK510_24720 [Calothrix elsteri CCALA 953]